MKKAFDWLQALRGFEKPKQKPNGKINKHRQPKQLPKR